MLKKFLKLIKKNEVVEETVLPLENKDEEVINTKLQEEIEYDNSEIAIAIAIEEELKEKDPGEDKANIASDEDVVNNTEFLESDSKDDKKVESEDISFEQVDDSLDLEFIKEAKIKRGMSIKAIDLYTQEETIFKTHKECSKKLKVPVGYIKENLKYGYTDYLGEAIIYLSSELQSGDSEFDYLNSNKSPIELYNMLNKRIFTARISEKKREDILSSDKIEPINMHYRFECLDEAYDDYFTKYKSIIQRGGKKKIELVDKKGEAIEIFKSLEECSLHLNKEKHEVVDMLKYGETKVGRYEIRYSLRNI